MSREKRIFATECREGTEKTTMDTIFPRRSGVVDLN